MAKKRYIVTLDRGGLFLAVAGEKWPRKHTNGALVKLDPEDALPLVQSGKIRPFDSALDGESKSDSDTQDDDADE